MCSNQANCAAAQGSTHGHHGHQITFGDQNEWREGFQICEVAPHQQCQATALRASGPHLKLQQESFGRPALSLGLQPTKTGFPAEPRHFLLWRCWSSTSAQPGVCVQAAAHHHPSHSSLHLLRPSLCTYCVPNADGMGTGPLRTTSRSRVGLQ